ncbi:SpoIIE family protein phosphatase [Desulfospira joergensenii]|uniref:SpoIIE family protein phosphatase n=1 Tax=Desulfospira joergensenii TaxID=53329 RepID=UPI00041EA464|nr:SpoIIE family protein phosphatase [Desulfospira joergensenii]
MIRIGLGQAEGINTRSLVSRVILACRSQINGDPPQAGILLAGSQFDHPLMLEMINDAFPGIQLIGCTTAGNFSSDFGFSEDGITLAVLSSDDIEIGTGIGSGLSMDPETSVQEAVESARDKIQGKPALCLTFPARYNIRLKPVLNMLNAKLGKECPVFGGASATLRADGVRPLQFFGRKILTDALPILLMAGPVRYAFSIANSWRPLGKKSEVTKACGRSVEKIGDLTAVDFYRHYLGFHEEPAMEFLLAVYEKDQEEFYLRVPVKYQDDGSVTFSETLPQGAFVQLTEAVPEDLTQDLLATADSLKGGARDWEPAFALAFSCAFRKLVLGTQAQKELDIFKKRLSPGLPILGFYAFGEISPLVPGGKSLSHVATLVSLLIGSESNAPVRAGRKTVHGDDSPLMENLKEQNAFLTRKLNRSEESRQRLEFTKGLNSRMLRRIIAEVDEARRKIQHKENQLRHSEEKFRRIVQTTGEGFILLDETFRCIEVNDSLCRMMECSRSDIIGRSHLDFATKEFREFLVSNREEMVKKESRKVEGTFVARKSGRHVPALVHGNTLRDDQGEIIGHMAFITDMTEQKKALALAGEVQRSLMPREIPRIKGLDIAGRSLPCDEVGGDYYDFFWDKEAVKTSFSVAVGDISGHGVDAALLMTSARAFLRLNTPEKNSLPETINAANQHLADDVFRSGRFMTLFYLTIDENLSTIEWVRAGHDPAMIYDPKSDTFEELKGPGMALGVDERFSYQSNLRTGLEEGQIIAVGTDGIWEISNTNREMLGKKRFQDLIRRYARCSAQDILSGVFKELEAFSKGKKPDDDLTLVIIKIQKS